MNANHGLCFLIADGEHARLVTADADNVLRTVRSFDSGTAHLASRDLAADRPGRVFESASTTRHGVQPRHDPHELAKTKFAQLAAAELANEARAAALDRLVIIAPAHCLSDIEAALDTQTAALVAGRLAKDLVKVPDHELSPHLHAWIGMPKRA